MKASMVEPNKEWGVVEVDVLREAEPCKPWRMA